MNTFPRSSTRYGNPLTRSPLDNASDKITNFFLQICDPQQMVSVAKEEVEGKLNFRTITIPEAVDFCLQYSIDRNVVAYLPYVRGVNIRLPYEPVATPFTFTRDEAYSIIEYLDTEPSLLVDSGDEVEALYLFDFCVEGEQVFTAEYRLKRDYMLSSKIITEGRLPLAYSGKD